MEAVPRHRTERMKSKAFAILSVLSVQAFLSTAHAQAPLPPGSTPGPAPAPVPGLTPAPAPGPGPGAGAGAAAGGTLGAGGEVAGDPGGPFGPPAVAAERTEADEWAERDSKMAESPALVGGVGLLHMPWAQGGAPGQFRYAFMTEYFSSGFLCSTSSPCQRGANSSGSLSHIGGTLSLEVQMLKWLEGYASTGGYANSSPDNAPSLIQVLGDTQFGLKAHTPIGGDVWHIGFSPELWLVNGVGSVGLLGAGTSAKFRGLVTADLRGLKSRTSVPNPGIRLGTTITYSLDNTGETIKGFEDTNRRSVTRVERFGLRINRVDHVDVNFGVEGFLVKEAVRPFAEYGIQIPINRQGYACKSNNASGDLCLANEAIPSSALTLGIRALPWKKNGFALTAAFDVGITGTRTFIEETSPTPPWTLYLGLGWAIDTKERPPVETVRVIDHPVPLPKSAGIHVTGFVHEAEKSEGINEALVFWEERPQQTTLATNPAGRFTTHELEPGPYTFNIKADGYKPGSCKVNLTSAQAGTHVQLDCPVMAVPRVGNLIGHVRDEGGLPVGVATIKVVDAARRNFTGGVDQSGSFRFEQVGPGTAEVSADAEGFMSYVAPFDVKARQDNVVDIVLQKRHNLVSISKTEIVIKQQVQFALDSAVILPASNALLTEIADVFIHNPQIKRVEVQGHTDSSGTVEHNRQLSEDRARSVVNWLSSHGVDPGRLVSKGYGQSKPLAPNVTVANRARNRRVQFVILEQTPVVSTTKPAAKPGAKGGAGTGPGPKKEPVPNFLK